MSTGRAVSRFPVRSMEVRSMNAPKTLLSIAVIRLYERTLMMEQIGGWFKFVAQHRQEHKHALEQRESKREITNKHNRDVVA